MAEFASSYTGDRHARGCKILRAVRLSFAHAGKRSEQHSYANPYTVEYTVVRAAQGGWRISNVLVTGGQ